MALIEIMTFQLAPNVDIDVFIVADALVQADFSYHQPGILRRTLARADDGEWLIHTIWTSADAARAAQVAFAASDLGTDFMALIDEATIDIGSYAPAGATSPAPARHPAAPSVRPLSPNPRITPGRG